MTQLPEAIRAWTEALGPEHVLTQDEDTSAYEANTSGLSRTVSVVLRPGSTEDVQQIVRIANRFQCAVYPFSTGFNWGLGARLPVKEETVPVDLSRMNRIHEVSVEGRYAVIEPGVTQRQLYQYLKDRQLPLWINVTGCGADTSLIGNSLERGIGYFSSRAHALSGMEVVLGTGEVLRTGFGHLPHSKVTHTYPHGIGPGYDQLFHQSNFGIVTSAGFRLYAEPEAHFAFTASIDQEAMLGPLMERLIALRRAGIIQHVIHVGNRERAHITLAPLLYRQLNAGGKKVSPGEVHELLEREGFGPWSAVAGINGAPKQLKEARRRIRQAFHGIAKVRFLTDESISRSARLLKVLRFLPGAKDKQAVLEALKPLHGFSKGEPTDAAMYSVHWPVDHAVPEDPYSLEGRTSGMLYNLPFFPADPAVAQEAVGIITEIFTSFSFRPCLTLNLVDDISLEAVITLPFDAGQKEERERAQACNEACRKKLEKCGYPIYRAGLQQMDKVVSSDNPHWKTAKALKQVFDPNGVISPGRYNIV